MSDLKKEVSTQVVTGKVRFSYCYVFEPQVIEEGEKPKYSVSIIIPKSDTKTLQVIERAIEAAKQAGKSKVADKNGNIPANLKTPLRDGDEERPDDPAYANAMFIGANSFRKPGIVDKNLNAIMSQEEFYSGCYGRASLTFYAYNIGKSKGIACGLQNLQKLEDGEPLTGGTSAEEDFGGDNQWDDDELM